MTKAEIFEQITKKIEQGIDTDSLVTWLHELDLPILDTIKIVRESLKIPLAEAKEIVTEHPAWVEVADKSRDMHTEATEAIQDRS